MRKRPAADWHPEDIKAAVRKSDFGSLAALARASGLAPSVCHHALRAPRYGGELAIARALGLEPWEIWPTRYRADGEPKYRPRREWKSNDAEGPAHRQNLEAA